MTGPEAVETLALKWSSLPHEARSTLRRKLEADPNRPRFIRTEPWVGYRFSPEPDD